MPRLPEQSQEEYCRDCIHHIFGFCNVILKDDELECGDKAKVTWQKEKDIERKD